jgi:hypothetical protein
MSQQRLVPKTRFEKQIPFPLLDSIAAEVNRLETELPEEGIDVQIQIDELDRITADFYLTMPYTITDDDRKNLILLIAEAIRTVKYIDKHYV